MRDPQSLYDAKRCQAAEAAAWIADRSKLALGMGVAMPPAFMQALADRIRADEGLSRLAVYYMHANEAAAETILAQDLMGVLKLYPFFMSHHDRAFDQAGRAAGQNWVHFIPSLFHQVGRLLTEQIRPHCFVTTVSPMDKSGHFSLGTNADYGASLVRATDRIVVEVNENMPRTFGETLLHVSQVDLIIENNTPLMEVPVAAATPEDMAIADLIAPLIADRSTIQMGVGAVPEAVLKALSSHKDLGLHSELLSPGLVNLIRDGVLTGAAKSLLPHKHVFTLALGNRQMYDFIDDNPSVVGYPASWVNSPAVIRKNNDMISVNSAIEIDLSGQINSESLNGRQFSGTGGQLDFVRGAYLAPNGKSFIAMHSTAKKGTVSRIVPRLANATVTDPSMETHYVVTEYGIANLKGLSLGERAAALIDIAHPDHRENLRNEAESL